MKNLILILTVLITHPAFSQSWMVSHSQSANAKAPVITLTLGNTYISVHNETSNNRQKFRIVKYDNNLNTVIWDKLYESSNANDIILNDGLIDVDNQILVVGEFNGFPYYCRINSTTGVEMYSKRLPLNGRINKVIQLTKTDNDYAFIGTNIATTRSIHGRIQRSTGNTLWSFTSAFDDVFRTTYSLCELEDGTIMLAGGNYNSNIGILCDNTLIEVNQNTGAIIDMSRLQYTYTYTPAALTCTNSNIDGVVNIPGTNMVAFLYAINGATNTTGFNLNSNDYGVTLYNWLTNQIIWDRRYDRNANDGERGDDILFNQQLNRIIVTSRITSRTTNIERFIHTIDINNGNTIEFMNFNNLGLFDNGSYVINLTHNSSNNGVIFSSSTQSGSDLFINNGNFQFDYVSSCFDEDSILAFDNNISTVTMSYDRNTVGTPIDQPLNRDDLTNQIIIACENVCEITGPDVIRLDEQNIGTNRVFNGKYLVTGRIVFIGEITVDITNCDFIFNGCDAGLYFTQGARLRANNSVFRPCDERAFWEGITFDNTGNNKVHACVIKNALTGLHLIGDNSETVITGNLFQNNFRGLLFENSLNTGSVASNTFDVNNANTEYPLKCLQTTLIDRSFNGIRALNSNIKGSISQNNFVCQITSNSTDRMRGIILENSTAKMTKNNFTNQEIAIRVVDKVITSPIEISSNEIEYHSTHDNSFSQIVLINSNSNNLIANNKLTDRTGNYSFDGIEITNTSVNILENQISGFKTAIKVSDSRFCKLVQNEITNSTQYGIYTQNCNDILVNCNKIKMLTLNPSDPLSMSNPIGLAFNENDLLANSNTQILSNCVFDAHIALYMYKSFQNRFTKFPIIRNNFLYNYYFRGMEFENAYGSVGNSTNYGRNTLYSNIQGVMDVYTNNPGAIDLYYNYMLSPTSFNANINNNLEAHSTAYCANQINLSQKVPNADITSCDSDFPIEFNPGGFGDPSGIIADTIGYLTTLIDKYPLNYNMITNTNEYKKLDQEGQLYIEYYYNYVNANYDNSITALINLIALDQSKESYRLLLEKMFSLKGNYSDNFSKLFYSDSALNYMAVSNLNLNPNNAYDYLSKPYPRLQISEFKYFKMPEFNSFLVYPNPANNVTNVKVDNYYGKNVIIRVIDITGKVLLEYQRQENNINISIPLSELEAGVYLVSVEIDTLTRSEKLIIY